MKKQEQQIVKQVAERVKRKFDGEGSGHDWWHIYRVWQMVRQIAKAEKQANVFVVELGALLHDIADWKFHGGNLLAGPREATKLLKNFGVEESIIQQVCHIVEHVSFKGSHVKESMESLEGKIVQDADRLDAIGAIGVARNFVYGGHRNIPIHVPGVKPIHHKSFEVYKNHEASGTNHFYEKLLLLKNRMNTREGKRLAKQRHAFMEQYLKEFFAEWDGRR